MDPSKIVLNLLDKISNFFVRRRFSFLLRRFLDEQVFISRNEFFLLLLFSTSERISEISLLARECPAFHHGQERTSRFNHLSCALSVFSCSPRFVSTLEKEFFQTLIGRYCS